ncbi:MAG TPA: YCF48-related protein [Bacteroidales bacterium]
MVLIILHLTLSCEIKAQTGWFWQNPLPQGNSLYGVEFISSTEGWAVGANGTILKTSDGGASWQIQ